jgi:hypothetical protein
VTLYGWDASDFDWPRGPMDLAAARADGISFFTNKATESTNTQHVHYGEAMNRARAAGIPFLGAYHVVRTLSVSAQVDYHLAYVNAQTPWWSSFPGWFFQADLEEWSYDAVAPSLGVAFAAEVERRTGRRCLLYAPEWAYGDTIGGSAPLWASSYGVNPKLPYRAAYPGDTSLRWGSYSGRTPVILQFGSQATIGRQPGCDINAFRGTSADFAQLIRGEAVLGGGTPLTPSTTTPVQPEDDMSATAEATIAELQKRLDDFDTLFYAIRTQVAPAVGEIRGNVRSLVAGALDQAEVTAAVKAALPVGSSDADASAIAEAVVAAVAVKLGGK